MRVRVAFLAELTDEPETVCECGTPLAVHPPLRRVVRASSGRHPEVWSGAGFGTVSGQRWTPERRAQAAEFARRRGIPA